MTIFGVNKLLHWVQVLADSGRRFTCPTKEINGELFFRFKNEWHKVAKYVSEHTTELSRIGDKIVEKKFMK